MLHVTLIIPVRNEALNLSYFISEILKLKTFPSEIIFVDTGSIDKSVEIINMNKKKFELNNIAFKLMHLPNGFPGAARNLGIRAAKNIWVAFLDVGIYPNSNWLDELWRDILLNDVSIVYGQCIFNSDDRLGKIVCALSYGINQRLPVLPASIANKKIFENFGFFDEKLRACEDILWKNKIQSLSIKYYESKTAVVNYSVFPNQISRILTKWFIYSKNESMTNITPVLRIYVYLYIINFLVLFFINYEFGLFFLFIYLIVRGMIDPWARSKYKKWWTNWFQYINTPFLALLMDVSSLLGYIYGKCKKLKKS